MTNKPIVRLAASFALCAVAATSLQGCVGLVVGTAVAGAMAATDRRTLGAQTEDKAILVKGETRIPAIVGDAGHVNVTSFNRKVLLTGEVKDQAMKQAVEREVASIEGVTGVINELEIAGPSSLTSRSNDALVTTKVKASLVENKQVSAHAFKVVTERGIVYLMGLVTQREGEIAAEVTRGVGGVHKVVKILDYITEDQLKSMSLTRQDQ
ncbi:MAG: putative phospholipid-binding domain protein [Paucimonas sp.]|nr:putative phospholipid-binding domain protein [Paucimonas sp.]